MGLNFLNKLISYWLTQKVMLSAVTNLFAYCRAQINNKTREFVRLLNIKALMDPLFYSQDYQRPISEQLETQLIHYKNCVCQGQMSEGLKQNFCILFLDNGEIVIGNHKNDQLNGECLIFLDHETYVIGNFVRGLLDGQFVLRSSRMTIYWAVRMNKIEGEVAVLNYEAMVARLWIIEDGQGRCTKQIDILPIEKEVQTLSRLSSYIEPQSNIDQFFKNISAKQGSEVLSIERSNLTQTTCISIVENSFYRLKVYIFKEKVIEYGMYQDDELNEMGFKVEGGTLYEGSFKNGKLHGEGLKSQLSVIESQEDSLEGKIIYGRWKNGDIRTVDVVTESYENAKAELKIFKKQLHIHSLEFINNYFNERPVLLLTDLLHTVENNERKFNKLLKEEKDREERGQNILHHLETSSYSKQQNRRREPQFYKDRKEQQSEYRNRNFSDRDPNNLSLQQGSVMDNSIEFMDNFSEKGTNFPNNSVGKNPIGREKPQSDRLIQEYNLINKALRKFK